MTAALNGVPLLQIAPVVWNSVPGFQPYSTIVFVDDESLVRVLENTRNATLLIGDRLIQNLIVKSVMSGSGSELETQARAVELVDRRYLLTRRIYQAAFNVRRRNGSLSVGPNDIPIQVQTPIPQVSYIPQTLKNGVSPYTVKDALQKILDDIAFGAVELPSTITDIEVFGASGYQKSGTQADLLTDFVSNYLPGFKFALKDDGAGYFYDVMDIEEESKQLDVMMDAVYGGGLIRAMDRRYERPSKIEFYFLAEPELRFDYDESQDEIYGLSSPVDDIVANANEPQPADLESVVEVPLPGLQINGIEAARGSLVNLFAFLNAMSSAQTLYPLPSSNRIGPITTYTLRRLIMRPWEQDAQYVTPGGFQNRAYGRVWSEINSSYRKSYRLARSWVDRVRVIKPVRAELIDATSLTRRQSPVFSDYSSVPGDRYNTTKSAADWNHPLWFQTDSVQDSLEDCLIAPARITGVDSESKTFGVQYRRTPAGNDVDVIPYVPDPLPQVLNQENAKIALSMGLGIRSPFKMATVLTVLPYPQPGSLSNFHKVTVEPKDAALAAGVGVDRIGECDGPVMQVFIPEGPLTTARFAYSEAFAEELAKPFFDPSAEFPSGALANKEDVDAIARGYAAAIYLSMVDQLEGSQTAVAIGRVPELAGTISQVKSTANKDGIFTSIRCDPRSEPLNPMRFIPSEVRNRLLQTIVP